MTLVPQEAGNHMWCMKMTARNMLFWRMTTREDLHVRQTVIVKDREECVRLFQRHKGARIVFATTYSWIWCTKFLVDKIEPTYLSVELID